MNIGGEGFLAVVGQEEEAEGIEVAGGGEVFELDGSDGDAAFEQGEGEAVDVAEVAIAGGGIAPLEHE